MASNGSNAEQEALRAFARDVNREVSVRCRDHKPLGETEKVQAAQGCCELWELDAVRSRVAGEAEGYFGDVDTAGRAIS